MCLLAGKAEEYALQLVLAFSNDQKVSVLVALLFFSFFLVGRVLVALHVQLSLATTLGGVSFCL